VVRGLAGQSSSGPPPVDEAFAVTQRRRVGDARVRWCVASSPMRPCCSCGGRVWTAAKPGRYGDALHEVRGAVRDVHRAARSGCRRRAGPGGRKAGPGDHQRCRLRAAGGRVGHRCRRSALGDPAASRCAQPGSHADGQGRGRAGRLCQLPAVGHARRPRTVAGPRQRRDHPVSRRRSDRAQGPAAQGRSGRVDRAGRWQAAGAAGLRRLPRSGARQAVRDPAARRATGRRAARVAPRLRPVRRRRHHL